MTHALDILTRLGVVSVIGAAVAALASVRLKWTKNAAVDRTEFRALGISFAFSRYDPDRFENVTGPHDSGQPRQEWRPEKLARPFSGAALGIAWSFWIYTRRKAYGRARVRDWALPAYLQVIVADVLLITESGDVVIKPAKRYRPGEHIRVVIANKNPCVARGEVTADVLIEREVTREGSGRTWDNQRTMYGRAFTAQPTESRVVELDIVAPGEDVTIERVKYQTEPVGDFRVGRLHGRPEWQA